MIPGIISLSTTIVFMICVEIMMIWRLHRIAAQQSAIHDWLIMAIRRLGVGILFEIVILLGLILYQMGTLP